MHARVGDYLDQRVLAAFPIDFQAEIEVLAGNVLQRLLAVHFLDRVVRPRPDIAAEIAHHVDARKLSGVDSDVPGLLHRSAAQIELQCRSRRLRFQRGYPRFQFSNRFHCPP
jgi:hypothetical protein